MAKRKTRAWDDKRWAGRGADAIASDETLKDDEPGLYGQEHNIDEVLTPLSFTITSGAIHSVSEGWLPQVMLTLELVKAKGLEPVGTINVALEQETCMLLMHHLEEGLDRSREDAKVAFGDIKFIPKRND